MDNNNNIATKPLFEPLRPIFIRISQWRNQGGGKWAIAH